MSGSVTPLSRRDGRDRRVPRVIEAHRALRGRRTGRVWINGREVGGSDPRFAHLSVTHD
jgi:hypothetical protein